MKTSMKSGSDTSHRNPSSISPEIEQFLKEAFKKQQPLKYTARDSRSESSYVVKINEDPVKALKNKRSLEVSPIDNPPLMITVTNPAQSLTPLSERELRNLTIA